jgi:hypothetical protein
MDTVKFDEVVCIDWYWSERAAEDLEANDWYWNGEIVATGTVCIYKCSDEIIAWSSEQGERKQFYLQTLSALQDNLRDVRKTFSGNTNQSIRIACIGNPDWEDELELGPNDIYGANDGNGEGAEISVKKQKSAIKKNPNRLLCVRRNVYKGNQVDLSEEEIFKDGFWSEFELIDDLERSAFIFEK